jgi:hypothetical protein
MNPGLAKRNRATQLAQAKRPNRWARGSRSRPLVEQLQFLSANDLARYKMFPAPHELDRRIVYPNVSLRFPLLARLVVSLSQIEATLRGGCTETIGMYWARCTFGKPRPIFICPRCGRHAIKVYLHNERLACRHCHRAVRLSQKVHSRLRPVLRAHKIERYLALKSNSWKRSRARLLARYGEQSMMPQQNYGRRSPCHWK